jgi:hypothetical protein
MSVESHVYSAHALIALSGDAIKAGEHVFLMLHDVQFDWQYKDTPNMVAFLREAHATIRSLLTGIATEEQIAYILKDNRNELYLKSDEVEKAFNNVHKERSRN